MTDHADIDHTGLTGTGGNVATDAIWDAAGDLAVGSGANTAAKLTKGSNGTVLTVTAGAVGWAAPVGGGLVAYDVNSYTGGDIALTSTSMAAVSGPTDLVVAASTGDILEVGISISAVTTTAQSVSFDMATFVSAAPVTYIGTGTGTPANVPIQHWFIPSGVLTGCGGNAWPYAVQAGDISGGNVTLRLYARVSGNRSINADSSNPLVTWVKNIGQ